MSEAVVEGISGAIGGMIALTATYPLNTISTRQATHVKGSSNQLADETAASEKPQGTLAEIAKLIRLHGWRELFAGLQPSLAGTAMSQGVYFFLYSTLRQQAVHRRQAGLALGVPRVQDISVFESLLVAALAGAGNVLVNNPIWLVATRMQASKKGVGARPAPSTLSVMQQVYEEYGITGFWKGVVPSLVMVINPTIQYVLYEWLARQLAAWRKKSGHQASRPTGFQIFNMMMGAKLGATLLTYPMLVIKMRMMSARKDSEDHTYSGVGHAVETIFSSEGVTGFYNGFRAKVVQSVLAAGLLFLIKEELTQHTRRLLAKPLHRIKTQ